MTADLFRRVVERRDELVPTCFTAQYGVKLLVWFEVHDDENEAFTRERLIKEWRRAWKVSLIEEANPHWADLAVTMFGLPAFPPYVKPLRPK